MNIIEISDLSSEALAPYARLTEAQLKRVGEGKGLFIAESPNVIEAAADAGLAPLSFLTERRHLASIEKLTKGRLSDIPIYVGSSELLENLTGFRLSRGMLAAIERPALPQVGEIVSGASRVAVLEGINDAENIGTIFRSAAALGMDAVLVGSSCCDPLNRRAARVSMGAVFRVPWTVLEAPAGDRRSTDVALLRSLGFKTAALALTDASIPPYELSKRREERLALLLGSEGDGLMRSTIDACDYTVRIPMAHGVDSLNVAAAAAIAFYELGLRLK